MTEVAEREDDVQIPEIVPASYLDGMPLFVAEKGTDTEVMIEQIRSAGYSIFYVIGHDVRVTEQKTATNTVVRTTHTKPRLFRVVSNLIGSAVSPIDEETLGLADIDQVAYFSLPSIPWELINDIDLFFREVHRIHKTEAVVLFTYDPEFLESENPSDGWGILVPDQTNTAGSCHYEPTSIVDDKPDEAYLVGSAHSHPGMSAFCSGTDKQDQSDFDGIHITFGWKSGSQSTEYYIELQMGGEGYVMKPEDTFTETPEPVENEKIQEWTKKVKKGTVAGKGWSTGYGGGYGDYWKHHNKWEEDWNLPNGLPSPRDEIVIVKPLLDKKEMKLCPICDSTLSHSDKESAKCLSCGAFLMWAEMDTIEDLIKYRTRNGEDWKRKELDVETDPYRSIWIWEEVIEMEGPKKGSVKDVVYEYHKGSRARQQEASGKKADGGQDVEEFLSALDQALEQSPVLCPVCGFTNSADEEECAICLADLADEDQSMGQHVNQYVVASSQIELHNRWRLCCDSPAFECDCAMPIFFAEIDEVFLEDNSTEEPYLDDAACHTCVLQYQVQCAPYRKWLKEWSELPQDEYPKQLDHCDLYTEITMEAIND